MQELSINALARISAVIVVSLVLGFGFDYLFIDRALGIGFPLYIIFIILGLLLLATTFQKQINKRIIWLMIPLGFFSLMIFVRSNGLLHAIDIIATIIILLIIAKLIPKGRIKNLLTKDYFKILLLPLWFIEPFFKTISDLIKLFAVSKNQKIISKISKGVIIAIPILAFFILLFSSADVIFRKYVVDLLDINLKQATIYHIFFVSVVTLIFMGAYSYIFNKKEPKLKSEEEQDTKKSRLGRVETYTFLGLVNLLFLVFILIQLVYLFGGESNVTSQALTYAEYARRGFFELIAIAVASFLLLRVTEILVEKRDSIHTLIFKILSCALIAQVSLIMISAFKRLWLYEQVFGFTTLRLYSQAFIFLLAAIFIILLIKIVMDEKDNVLAFRSFIAVLLFLAVMNIFNPDAFIAKKNIDLSKESGKLDMMYLYRLSDDAVPVMIEAYKLPHLDDEYGAVMASNLYWRLELKKSTNFFNDWQSFNISRNKAENLLESNIEELEKYKNFTPSQNILYQNYR